ncbi:MAG: phage terminase large subunit [Planctomycetota bacterium]
MKRSPTPEEAFLAAAASHFGVFIALAFQILYPGKAFEPNWHIDAIVYALERNWQGILPRLIFNLPPRHLKSFLISIAWPAFLLAQNPSLKIMVVSYSDELVKSIARDFRRLVESKAYRKLFPHVRITKATENIVETDQGGYRCGIPVRGSLTGRGADSIIVDDPCKPDDALTDALRNEVNDWYKTTLLSRRDDKRHSSLIIVMQRLHSNDLTGYVEGSGEYHKLSFPAIAEKDEEIEVGPRQTYLRRAGEALQPQRDDAETWRKERAALGAFNFAAQYQQSPRTPDGQIFRQKHIICVDRSPPFQTEGECFISVDSALSTSVGADYSAITIAHVYRRRLYVLRADRGRWEYEDLKEKTMKWIAFLSKSGRPVKVVVENAGSGISLVQFLKKTRDRRYEIFWRTPKESKVERARTVVPWMEMGIFLLSTPGKNGWVQPFVNEFMNFPQGLNDDQVDSLVQLLYWRRVTTLLDSRDHGDGVQGC